VEERIRDGIKCIRKGRERDEKDIMKNMDK
jgi:hypothetical protein